MLIVKCDLSWFEICFSPFLQRCSLGKWRKGTWYFACFPFGSDLNYNYLRYAWPTLTYSAAFAQKPLRSSKKGYDWICLDLGNSTGANNWCKWTLGTISWPPHWHHTQDDRVIAMITHNCFSNGIVYKSRMIIAHVDRAMKVRLFVGVECVRVGHSMLGSNKKTHYHSSINMHNYHPTLINNKLPKQIWVIVARTRPSWVWFQCWSQEMVHRVH